MPALIWLICAPFPANANTGWQTPDSAGRAASAVPPDVGFGRSENRWMSGLSGSCPGLS
jgi:hypothetical protein